MITVLVQGNRVQQTASYLDFYANQKDVNQVIFSCWKSDDLKGIPDDIEIVLSNKPENPGIGNRNLQIVSTFNAISSVRNETVVKVRSDMKLDEFQNMVSFYEEFSKGRILTLGEYNNLLFHPRDHVFWCSTEQLRQLFNLPLDQTPAVPYNEITHVRCETYIGVHYYALYDERIKKFIERPLDYLTDISPKRDEALLVYKEWQNKLFYPFYRAKVTWTKHHGNHYPYEATKNRYGEYWHGDKECEL